MPDGEPGRFKCILDLTEHLVRKYGLSPEQKLLLKQHIEDITLASMGHDVPPDNTPLEGLLAAALDEYVETVFD